MTDSAAVARMRLLLAAKKLAVSDGHPLPDSQFKPATIEPDKSPANSAVFSWNEEQSRAIEYGASGREFCLIGAAGTGKTTTVKEIAKTIIAQNQFKMTTGTSYLRPGVPAIAFVSFTNRAVKNLRRALRDVPAIIPNCLTIHKLLEFYPEYFDIPDGDGFRTSMEFIPKYTAINPIHDLRIVVVDESSMVDTTLFQKLKDACPKAKFIFLGDLNQLPPVFGDAILGYKLYELPVIELHRVYRQAMESPIVRFQHEYTLKGKLPSDTELRNYSQPGKLEFEPLKSEVRNGETMARAIAAYMHREYEASEYIPGEDIILIPYNKAFGTVIINREIAQWLGDDRGAIVHEVIGGGFKNYYAVGDFVIYNKNEYRIVDITPNPKYLGPRPKTASRDLMRTGRMKRGSASIDIEADSEFSLDDRLDFLFDDNDGDEVVDKASHIIRLKPAEVEAGDSEISISNRGDINNLQFGYAITVHKSQGSEWRKVYFIITNFHSVMLSREILYTGMTRAREHLKMIYSPQSATGKRDSSVAKSIRAQKIPGTTWRDKIEWFKGKKENGGAGGTMV